MAPKLGRRADQNRDPAITRPPVMRTVDFSTSSATLWAAPGAFPWLGYTVTLSLIASLPEPILRNRHLLGRVDHAIGGFGVSGPGAVRESLDADLLLAARPAASKLYRALVIRRMRSLMPHNAARFLNAVSTQLAIPDGQPGPIPLQPLLRVGRFPST